MYALLYMGKVSKVILEVKGFTLDYYWDQIFVSGRLQCMLYYAFSLLKASNSPPQLRS